MQTIYELFGRYIYPFSKQITIFFVVIVFSIVAYYLYNIQKTQTDKKNPAIYKAIDENDIRVYIFVADWCPACKKAMPEIDKFKRTYDGKTINNRKISVIKTECGDADENTETAQIINTFKVTAFPTIKLVKPDTNGNERTFEFDAKITQENLEGFLQTSLQK